MSRLLLLLVAASFSSIAFAVQTTTTVSVQPATAELGSPVVLTAIVTPSPGTGRVTFTERSIIIGSASISFDAASGTSKATYLASNLLPGSHWIKARFVGTAGFDSSLSSEIEAQVWSVPESRLELGTQFPNGVQAVSDFNNDGKLDVAGWNANFGSATGIFIAYGNGDGTFQPPVKVFSCPAQDCPRITAVADLRAIGRVDLIVQEVDNPICAPTCGDPQTFILTFLLNNGDGTFTEGTDRFVGVDDYNDAIIADFNRDGIPDLFGPGGLALGNGDGTFRHPPFSTIDPYGLVGDFNRDGKLDYLQVAPYPGSENTGPIQLYLGNGDGTFQPAVVIGETYCLPPFVGSYCSPVTAFDFNRDGKLDVVYQDSAVTSAILLGKGDGTFSKGTSFNVGAALSGENEYGVVDLNGDGKPDLISYNAAQAGIFYGNGDGTFGPFTIVPELLGAQFFGSFDLDGRVDTISSTEIGSTLYLGAK